MECLHDYIGLQQCNAPESPVSGLYINSLPGISTEILQKIASPEDATYRNLWNDVQRIAGLRFYTDVIGTLRSNYRLKKIRSLIEFIPPTSGLDAEVASAQDRGIHLRFPYQQHTFQAFTIAELMVVADAAGEMTARIYDKYGTELWTKTFSAVEGLNRVRVDKIFNVDELYAGFDMTTIGSYETTFAQELYDSFCDTCYNWCMDCEPTIEGYTKTGSTFETQGRNTHGVGIVGYLGCHYESLVCNNKALFASAWLYLLGVQVMVSVLSSQRNNQFTTVDRTKYEELRDHYQVEYEKQLKTALDGFDVNLHGDCCIECGENPKSVQWLP